LRIVGQVVQVKRGFEGDYRSESPDRATLYVRSGGDTIAVACHQELIPENLEDQCIRVDVRLREIRVPRYPARRFQELYEAENYPGVIRLLAKTMVRALAARIIGLKSRILGPETPLWCRRPVHSRASSHSEFP
jgi:hypothetical protein